MKQVTITGRTFPELSYFKTGQGPVITLLHGFPANANLWRLVSTALSKNYSLIIPHLPGVGKSKLNGDRTSMEELAQGINDIMDHENINKTVIAGHSMGGYVALAFAELFGTKLAGLSLVHSTAQEDTPEKKESRAKAIRIFEEGGKEKFVSQMVPSLFSDSFKDLNSEIVEQQSAEGRNVPAASLIAFYDAMMKRRDRTSVFEKNNFPVQFILGKEDKLIEIQKVLSQSRAANVNFVNIYGSCAHMSMLEKPEFLAHDIEEFSKYCFTQ